MGGCRWEGSTEIITSKHPGRREANATKGDGEDGRFWACPCEVILRGGASAFGLRGRGAGVGAPWHHLLLTGAWEAPWHCCRPGSWGPVTTSNRTHRTPLQAQDNFIDPQWRVLAPPHQQLPLLLAIVPKALSVHSRNW